MITRGVVKGVSTKASANDFRTNTIHYDVWIPFLDQDDSTITHDAVYCTLPHEQTAFNIGDVVYVAAVDL